MASPRAQGLFEGAIGESGGLFEPLQLAPNYLLANAEKDGEQYAASLGTTAVQQLRRLPASAFLGGASGQLHPNRDGTWTSTLGWTGRPDGRTVSFSDCTQGDIAFDEKTGRRIAYDVTDTSFDSHGTKLAGRLVMPAGSSKVPVVILVHGSEHDSALKFYALQRLFPAQGIGAFVYDKRGTGASGGVYTQDFDTLADDLVVATKEARRLAGARAGRVGF
jgi:hypothetical protein